MWYIQINFFVDKISIKDTVLPYLFSQGNEQEKFTGDTIAMNLLVFFSFGLKSRIVMMNHILKQRFITAFKKNKPNIIIASWALPRCKKI
jgi:hypothetical protein